MEKKIIEIPIRKVEVHPRNVRLTYSEEGLKELAESIKEHGVLQNLTVVPMPDSEDCYWTVIGNRRLLAAKMAGLETVPCTVVELSEKDQIATMLLENMQRKDLNPYEEAKGFQMCMELGIKEEELSKRTGLSKSTIKHRIKMAELDQKVVAEKAAAGATIFDFIKLEKIKNIETRNAVARYIGTDKFSSALSYALLSQEREICAEILREKLAAFTRISASEHKNKLFVQYIPKRKEAAESFKAPEDCKDINYYYLEDESGFTLCKDIPYNEDAEKAAASRAAKENDLARRKAEFEALKEEKQKKRLSFIHEAQKTGMRIELQEAQKYLAQLLMTGGFNLQHHMGGEKWRLRQYINGEEGKTFSEVFGLSENFTFSDVMKICESDTWKFIQGIAYCELERLNTFPVRSWDMKFWPDEEIECRKLYDFLALLDYPIDDEEEALLNGTHEVYVKEDKEDEE